MTPEQAAAFVMAQAACAMIEIASMQAQDRVWAAGGMNCYSDAAYMAVMEKYPIGHNAVMNLFQSVNR